MWGLISLATVRIPLLSAVHGALDTFAAPVKSNQHHDLSSAVMGSGNKDCEMDDGEELYSICAIMANLHQLLID